MQTNRNNKGFYMQFNHSKRTSKPINKKGKVENTLTYMATYYISTLELESRRFQPGKISLMSSQERFYGTHFSLISFKVYAIHKACTVMESPLQNITEHHICTLNIYLDNYSGCKCKCTSTHVFFFLNNIFLFYLKLIFLNYFDMLILKIIFKT